MVSGGGAGAVNSAVGRVVLGRRERGLIRLGDGGSNVVMNPEELEERTQL